MAGSPTPYSLLQLLERVRSVVAGSGLSAIWVTAETCDVGEKNGHWYMDLLQKDDRGRIVARIRATLWAFTAGRILPKFQRSTGRSLHSDMKVCVCVNLEFKPEYGLSLNILDIDPTYTLGDLMRRRMEAVARLTAEGIIDQNRSLEWPVMPWRIAVISGSNAAGYGDFINQLFTNEPRLRFRVKLFESLMQGDNAPAGIINALEAIANDDEEWDCVVIIRGGGAGSDLAAYEDYNLAAAIAMFPLPVVIGIGHERDVTLLDYVAKKRVKTPTAAAAWFIERGTAILAAFERRSTDIARLANERIAAQSALLARYATALPLLPVQALERVAARLDSARSVLAAALPRLASERTLLDSRVRLLESALQNRLERGRQRLDNLAGLLEALSPEQTLRRGYSITRLDGRALTDASRLKPGDTVTTVLAEGSFVSVVK